LHQRSHYAKAARIWRQFRNAKRFATISAPNASRTFAGSISLRQSVQSQQIARGSVRHKAIRRNATSNESTECDKRKVILLPLFSQLPFLVTIANLFEFEKQKRNFNLEKKQNKTLIWRKNLELAKTKGERKLTVM